MRGVACAKAPGQRCLERAEWLSSEVGGRGAPGCSLVSWHSGCGLGEWVPTPTPLTRAGLPQDTGQPALSHAAS